MTHSKKMAPLYTMVEEASEALANLAENVDSSGLQMMYDGAAGVCSTSASSGPVCGNFEGVPASIDIMVTVSNECPLVTVAAMAVNTNDCFVAMNGEELAPGGVGNYPGLDVGSEQNDELYSSVPGPACPEDSFKASPDGEGFVHVHRGFHGVGPDLSAQGYDLRNPMMQVMVTEALF